MSHVPAGEEGTARPEYAARLAGLQGARWKRILDVQAPYRRFLRGLGLGRTLDIGCGIGRNLGNLGPGAVGVDHNVDAIAHCRALGYEAYTSEEFAREWSAGGAAFDALLFAHVLEHMARADAVAMVRHYLSHLCPGGRVVMIAPQERGYRSDATHVEFLDLPALQSIAEECDLSVNISRSFPLPRVAGQIFTYNEFVVVARS